MRSPWEKDYSPKNASKSGKIAPLWGVNRHNVRLTNYRPFIEFIRSSAL
jgi:hypothetical protein